MAAKSSIEWCDSTDNFWIGCTPVSPGCDGCYAERSTPARVLKILWGPGEQRWRTSKANWSLPATWQRGSNRFRAEHGRDRRVFVNSLSDWADNEVPQAWRDDLWAAIRSSPDVTYLMLTKRVGNVARMLPADWGDGYPNVWLGISAVNQAELLRDAHRLIAIPAAKHWISLGPLLGPIDLEVPYLEAKLGAYPFRGLPHADRTTLLDLLDWIVVEGESDTKARPLARPMHPDWPRSIRDQCARASKPFFFKQHGEWKAITEEPGEWYQTLYRPNRLAHAGQDQDALIDVYGRRCAVPQAVVQRDGTVYHDGTEFGAWRQGSGAVLTFKIGKNAAGRMLDGVEHSAFPTTTGT